MSEQAMQADDPRRREIAYLRTSCILCLGLAIGGMGVAASKMLWPAPQISVVGEGRGFVRADRPIAADEKPEYVVSSEVGPLVFQCMNEGCTKVGISRQDRSREPAAAAAPKELHL